MSSFTARSASGRRVSLLNDEDVNPLDVLHTSPPAISIDEQSGRPAPPLKKQYRCVQCDRIFTTSGHLSRHGRVHTGEKNHHCPFPGCDKSCSRQDNLLQHFRMHLPKSERNIGIAQVRAALEEVVRAVAADKAGMGSLSSTFGDYPSPDAQEEVDAEPLSPSIVVSPTSADSPQTPIAFMSAKTPTHRSKPPLESYPSESSTSSRYSGRRIPGFEVSYIRGEN